MGAAIGTSSARAILIRRTACVVKWLAAGWVVAVVLIWIASGWWGFWWFRADRSGVRLEYGRLLVSNDPSQAPIETIYANVPWSGGWNVEVISGSYRWWFEWERFLGMYTLSVPLWVLVLPALILYWLAAQFRTETLAWKERMRSRASFVASAAGWLLAACTLGVVALWIVSIWWHVNWTGFCRYGDAGLWSGRLWFFKYAERPMYFRPFDISGLQCLRYTTPRMYWWFESGSDAARTWVYIPFWTAALTLAFAGFGSRWLGRWLRNSGAKQCPCGYSREGLPIGAGCPECGAKT